MCIHHFTRRQILTGLSATAAYSCFPQSLMADDKNVRRLAGSLDIAGFKARGAGTAMTISAQDKQTAFAIGEDAFLADERLVAEFELNKDGQVASLNVVAGQILSVFKPVAGRQTALNTPNASASIRGTGCFVDVDTDAPNTYLCCCYGEVAIENTSSGEQQRLKNAYHNARYITPEGIFAKVPYQVPLNHYDDQLVALEKAVGRAPHWQLPDDKMHFIAPEPIPFNS